MEELEDPTERLKETMEAAEEKNERWTLYVALSTAIIAVLAAIAGLFGNHHANEAMLEQVSSSDKWAFYQAKSIKAEVAASTVQILAALGKPVPEDNAGKIEQYKKDKEKIKEEAETEEKSSAAHMRVHVVYSRAVTIFQIAIAISAIAILTRKKIMWYASMLLMGAGCYFLVVAYLMQ